MSREATREPAEGSVAEEAREIPPMNMTAEEALKWTEQGWIVGSNLIGRSAWMQWVHGGKRK